MDSIKLSVVPKDSAVEEIERIIQVMYNKGHIDLDTHNTIKDLFSQFSSALAVCIEYPYVDKVYRNSYYNYFASKHNGYHRDCIRVSLFDGDIDPKYFRDKKFHSTLQSQFRGYIIIRPTFPNVIGRSMIDKTALSKSNFLICRSKGDIMLNGVKLNVEGFPFSSQDVESISCAETCIWEIMEYFGTKYPDYTPTYPSVIINVLNKFSDQRMLPSNGLRVDQISFALKEFGFGTYIYSKEAYKKELSNIIATYVESGIPIVAAIENKNVAHAILIVGHEIENLNKTMNYRHTLKYWNKTVKYGDFNDIPKKYVVQDDNLTPYRLISLSDPAQHYKLRDPEFEDCSIESIVVPLYSKIYLDAVKAKKLVKNIVTDKHFGFRFNERFILRFFLASSRSFKMHIASLDRLNEVMRDIIVLSKMPKFIWCCEFYEKNGLKLNQALGLIVVDATEANEHNDDALIFAGYPDRCMFKMNENIVSAPIKFNIYTKFKNNLG